MTRDYSKGKIYKLICNETGLVYYGHTTYKYLSQRLAKHKTDYTRWIKTSKHYITAFEVMKNNNYDMVLVESYPCNSIEELEARERNHIENNECVNKNIPGRSIKEWREANKEKIAEYLRQWREDNEDYCKEFKKQYYESNKDYILEKLRIYRNENRDKIFAIRKKFRTKHRDTISKSKKEYYEKNRDTLRETVVCECGSEVCRGSLTRHYKTKKHKEYINSIK
jgi:hypothetical protein